MKSLGTFLIAINLIFGTGASAADWVTYEGKTGPGGIPCQLNIDYQLVPSLPDDALYFHAQYRQATPNVAHTESKKNLGR